MQAVITESSGVHYNHNLIEVYDDDNRFIVIRAGHIKNLKMLLTKIFHERREGVSWKTETGSYDAKLIREE